MVLSKPEITQTALPNLPQALPTILPPPWYRDRRIKLLPEMSILIRAPTYNIEKVRLVLDTLDAIYDISMLDDENGTIYVVLNDQKEGLFLCPACYNGVTRDLSKVASAPTAIRVKCTCKCGHVFRVIVDRRQNCRKPVNLVGMCIFVDSYGQSKKRLIKIHDVSSTGLLFSVNDLPEFKVSDDVIVEFMLDDTERTKIMEKGTIVRIQDKNVGLKFHAAERERKFNLYLID